MSAKKFIVDGNFTLILHASTTVTNKEEAHVRALALLDLAQKEGLLTDWYIHPVKEVGA